MDVGILGSATDLHSEVVRWGMERAGVRCHVLDTLHGAHTHEGTGLFVDNIPSSVDGFLNRELRALWYRRHYKVRSPASEAPDENDVFRTSECNIIQENIVAALSIDSTIEWINNPRHARLAESKFVQLLLAKKVGISVPATLMTADPGQIRKFAARSDEIVVKPFGVYSWQYADRRRTYALASKVESRKVIGSADAALSNTPAIYQSVADKKSDLRVVVVGRKIHAYNVVQTGAPDFDCRFSMTNPGRATIERYELSRAHEEKILDMMSVLGLDMASADFALTANDDIVFLDLNPAGAWLFLEERVPDVSLVGEVCRLLAAKAGITEDLQFPDYADFKSSSAVIDFNKRCVNDTARGITFINDRTWSEAS